MSLQILAIESFSDEKYAKNAQALMKKNEPFILKLHEKGFIRAFWSRGDKMGVVLLLQTDSIAAAKKVLGSLPLVKKRVTTYNLLPLLPYQVEELLPEEKEFLTLVYVSQAEHPMDRDALNEILQKSRINNKKLDITGVLLYENGSFFQLIEGKEKPIRALYKKICNDKRHKHIAKVIEIKSHEKNFSQWSMGHADITKNEIETLEGMNDFFQNDNCFIDLNHEQIESILGAFKDGRFRQKIK